MGNRLNFTFEEFFASQIADRLNIDNTTSNPKYLNNWMNLVHFCLQPIRDKLVKEKKSTALIITGAFRCKKLVEYMKCATTGHPDGECADLSAPSLSKKELFYFIFEMKKQGELEYDQLIWEKDSNCVHLGYRGDKNRNETLIRQKINGEYKYQRL